MSLTLTMSILALLISCLSLLVAYGRLRATYSQLMVQNLLRLSEYLHQTEFSEARHKVRTAKRGEVDPEAFRKLCSSFDLAGLFVRNGLVDEKVFLDYWGGLLIFLQDHISDNLHNLEFGNVTGQQYYRHFQWLLNQATKDTIKFHSPIK